jgi:glycosyltransferase involved in cell wall biosynthesis
LEKLSRELENSTIEAELQANVMFQRDWPSSLAVQRLRRLKVKLIENELSTDDYDALLKRASIVLLPYSLVYYHAQTSGIFCEALAQGKPVVVPRGTWMARQLKDHGAGESFLPGDRPSFYEAVLQAVYNYAELKKRAVRSAPAWIKEHNPDRFLRLLANSF